MNSLFRTASLLLSCLTVLPLLASCTSGRESPAPGTDALISETETAAADPNDRSQIKDSLPDTLDFTGRTFTIYCGHKDLNRVFFEGPEEESAEVVDTAVFRRNRAVSDRLGITLRSDTHDDTWSTIDKSILKLVMAGDSTYDFFLGQTAGITKLVTENCLFNAYDLEYLDFTQPWWNNHFMDELAIGDQYRFLLVSDYTIDALAWTRAIFFNKVLYANYFDQADDLYQEVFDGKWTLDRMAELSAAVFIDLNNDGKTDAGDQLGFSAYLTFASTDAFVYATDIPFTKRDENGFITLTMMNDDAVTLAEKLNSFFWQPGSFSQFAAPEDQSESFLSGKTLFYGNAALRHADSLRDMKDDFGFLPYPKFDEAQEQYSCLVHDGALIGAFSGASQNLDIAGAVLEALSAETYRTVTPAWYETALKIKYSRDDLSTQMIDLIYSSSTTNFIYAYNYALEGIGLLYRDLVTANSADYASLLKKKEKLSQKKLDAIIESFTASDS